MTRLDIYRLLRALDEVMPLDPEVICGRLGLPPEVVGHALEQGWAVPAGRGEEVIDPDGARRRGPAVGLRLTPRGAAARTAMLRHALEVWGGVRVPWAAGHVDGWVLGARRVA